MSRSGGDLGGDSGGDLGADSGADSGADLGADFGVDLGADFFSTVSLVYTGHMTNGSELGGNLGADSGGDLGADWEQIRSGVSVYSEPLIGLETSHDLRIRSQIPSRIRSHVICVSQ